MRDRRVSISPFAVQCVLSPTGIDAIEPDEIYERPAFTGAQIAVLRRVWVIQRGRVQDRGAHQGTELLRFVRRK